MHADQRTAWRNPEWVRAVMHYPDDTVLLDRLATGAELTVRKRVEDELQQDAMRAGKAAANVLLTLYALDQAKWTLPCAPSLAVATHCAERLELADRAVDAAARRRGETPPDRVGPQGHTKIEVAYNRMRPVAHLWAATKYYGELTDEGMPRTPRRLLVLLGIARAIQEWAREWKPPRTRQHKSLLGDSPWLVPPTIPALAPTWSAEPPALLMEALKTYRRRSRG